METLADQLAVAFKIINLCLQKRDQSQRLAVSDEHDSINHYLQDGMTQSIYAMGLTQKMYPAKSVKSRGR